MEKTDKFSKGDKVIRVGTKAPVMSIKSKSIKGGLPYVTLEKKWTCFWNDSGPHWEEINEANLELLNNQ